MSNKKNSNGKKLTPTQHLPHICGGTLLTRVLTLMKTEDALSKIDFQGFCGSKLTVGGPINYRTLNPFSKIAELKHNVMHKCSTFSASRLFHHFFNVCTVCLYTLSKCFGKQNQLGLHILIHWRSYALGFCEKPKRISSQGMGHPNANHTLKHCGKIPCLKTLVGTAHYLISSLRYTLPYYSVEPQPTIIHCWAIPNHNTLLR